MEPIPFRLAGIEDVEDQTVFEVLFVEVVHVEGNVVAVLAVPGKLYVVENATWLKMSRG